MSVLTLHNVLVEIAREVEEDFAQQVLDENSPIYGAFLDYQGRIESAGHGGTTRFLVSCGYLVLARLTHPAIAPSAPDTDTLLFRMSIAADSMLRAQRDTGLIDLRSTNYDSSPDTGFVVQLLCAFTDLARGHDLLKPVLDQIERFIRRAVPGIMTGGFHTPNHRWVIVGALAYTAKLFPDIDTRETVRAYVAEGFDVDAEGTYLERSVGVYDAVTNRSLLIFADHWDDEADIQAAHEAVNANLTFNLHLLHTDGTAETGLSRRQDYSTRVVPTTLIASYLHAAKRLDSPLFARAAQWLWEQSKAGERGNFSWQAYTLMKFGEPEPSSAELPRDFVAYYPINRVWRVRQADLSATVFGGVSRLMTLVYKSAELSGIKISQTYFGIGQFVGDSMRIEGNTAILRYKNRQKPHRPGYELPYGKPVPRDQWDAINAQRDYKPLPPMTSELAITVIEGGFDLRYQTLDGLDQVATQIAFDFPAGGLWETDDTAFVTQPGQEIFLKRGYGRMQFGNDVIELGPGANAHMYQQMRQSELVEPGYVRVLLTFVTPVDHTFSLRVKQLPR
ncbi:MAG: hypothetical protein JXA10_11970 [Anaerolineae bacterium]|nr:hypothetical protein [Anaerolineae bacterium]